MRSMQWRLGILGTKSVFAYRHRETKKNLCRGGRSQRYGKRSGRKKRDRKRDYENKIGTKEKETSNSFSRSHYLKTR